MIRILLICLFSLISSSSLLLARDVVFYHTDNVGTPVAMTDSSGAVVWRAHDKPFGEEFQTTTTPQNSRRFIGKEKDKETGLVYIGARYLDPETGRFIQPDPVGPVDSMTGKVNIELLNNPQRLNRYAYGLNNPYRYIDPNGRDAILVKYIGYQVNTGLGFKLPLGHSAVIAVNPDTGLTKYYEYGRYGSKFGKVNNPTGAPGLEIKEGKPTEKSLKKLYNYVSDHYGQGKPVQATYYSDGDFHKTDDFATERMNDKNRQPYSLLNNNCKTFANETIQAGRKEE
ncbi:MAG: RHS repeat-associated core domain-containing protein [Pseudomonadota bacterium]